MDVKVEPGTYVAAVSGGVDSMALLDLLAKKRGLKLVVAHFDHGIRTDSEKDRLFVESVARKYGLPFVYAEGKLGAKASEASARNARYEFLEKVRKASGAEAIITAHHQDDLLETAIINILRGTGRLGLSSLKDRPGIRRPLLNVSKAELKKHAEKNKLKWREDKTNLDIKYLRNYIRHEILPRFSQEQKKELLGYIEKAQFANLGIEKLLGDLLSSSAIDRQWFIMLPHDVAAEVLADWLRGNKVRGFDKKLINKLVADAKTLKPGKQVDVDNRHFLRVEKDKLALSTRER